VKDSEIEARVHLPHYWAVFFHDGRGPIKSKGKKLIYFANPANDPRLAGGYPITRSDIKTLSQKDYEDGLQRNKELRDTGQVYMYVLDAVGPSVGNPFFEEGMKGFAAEVDQIVLEELGRTSKTFIDATKESMTIVIEI